MTLHVQTYRTAKRQHQDAAEVEGLPAYDQGCHIWAQRLLQRAMTAEIDDPQPAALSPWAELRSVLYEDQDSA